MKSLLKHFLCFCVVYLVKSATITADPATDLILVSVIFRHGARTTTGFYPNDPNKGQSFYPIGMGGLTNDGKLGEYKLGRYLKSLYGDFLGDVYTEDEVWVRSTDVSRTKMSAQLVLAGLFPPNEIQQWNQDLEWQPIPVSYKSDSEEDLFHPWGTCPYKSDVINHLLEIEEVQDKYIKPYKETMAFIQENSGKSMTNPADMQDILFNFKTEDDMGLIIPDWVRTIYPEPIQSIAAQVYGYHNYDPRTRQINSGYMLKKILDDSKNKIEGNSKKKIYLYSGHESTLGYMLNALNVNYKAHVPPYGSAISFEIHKANDYYYVKLRYRNDTEATEPVELNIPKCGVLCPYDQFVQLQKDLIPTISIQDACRKNNYL
ncbi:venom acid phosphatase Acph-1-like isoform X1 [Tribolium madens]|uniref:venom acid phosphatase Acph-1-like isoform X1 n=1 Tax=Tribolium madens TaxID=41895 RepID=UPI001CF76425|nr:venom acid phosphatase Acph-1-like isoform X1 [Tribolium madens]